MAKNVLQRHWNGNKFEEIHPVTKALNVFTSDGKSIEQKVNEHLAEKASLTKAGHVQLSNSTASTSNTLAATPAAVKAAMDRADAAFTSASNARTDLTTAITGVDPKVVIPADPTFSDLAMAIGQISTGKKWASGRATSSSTLIAEVNDMDFEPSFIQVEFDKTNVFYKVVYDKNTASLNSHFNSLYQNYTVSTGSLGLSVGVNWAIRSNGFSLTVPVSGSKEVSWVAFE